MDNKPADTAEALVNQLSEAMNLAQAHEAILKKQEADEATPDVVEEEETESQPVAEDEEVEAVSESDVELEPEDNREE